MSFLSWSRSMKGRPSCFLFFIDFVSFHLFAFTILFSSFSNALLCTPIASSIRILFGTPFLHWLTLSSFLLHVMYFFIWTIVPLPPFVFNPCIICFGSGFPTLTSLIFSRPTVHSGRRQRCILRFNVGGNGIQQHTTSGACRYGIRHLEDACVYSQAQLRWR